MQVDPIKPELKAPEIKLLTLKYDESLSTSAFNLNLRRYSEGGVPRRGGGHQGRAVQVDPIKTRIESTPGFSA